ncbi:proteolipid protein 2 isoform X1 [Alligator mississippiensis]|uniref:Proteolipid protein 2 n=1 Tax=Alligator mississippiensis TaxID=8496 RepID=A0A151NQB7_ALLMI|nr:proteolipid protein 2 isoform X1 [Alligator mississippiensis]KYO38910.1 proteolipid protein 2 [Alligator mississippiensis]
MEAGSGPSCLGQLRAFLSSRKGIVLATEIGLCIFVLICYGASRTPGYSGVAIFEMIFAIVFLIVFTLGLHKQITVVHWGWSDFIRTVIGCLLFIIASLIVIVEHRDAAGTVGGVFGLLAGIVFGYDCYLTFPSLRKSHAPAPTESPEGA